MSGSLRIEAYRVDAWGNAADIISMDCRASCREPPQLRCLILCSREFIITRKSDGDRIDLCFTPQLTRKVSIRQLVFVLHTAGW